MKIEKKKKKFSVYSEKFTLRNPKWFLSIILGKKLNPRSFLLETILFENIWDSV